jgi:hypothetical protein
MTDLLIQLCKQILTQEKYAVILGAHMMPSSLGLEDKILSKVIEEAKSC